MANVLASKLIRWCSLLPIGIAACIGSIHLTNVSKPIVTLDSLELEKIPEVEEEEITPEEKPPETPENKSQESSQPQPQPQDPQTAAAESKDSGEKDDEENTNTSPSTETEPQSSSDVSADQTAAVVGGAVATGADEPIEVIRRGLIGISRMNTSEGRVKELVSISSLLNTVNQLTTAAKQIQLDKTGNVSSNPSASTGNVTPTGSQSPQVGGAQS